MNKKRGDILKIKINTEGVKSLEEIKENIDKLLSMNLEDIEVTEENQKKVKDISETLYKLNHLALGVGNVRLKIEASDGTSFTIL